jgi:hypothetical protein
MGFVRHLDARERPAQGASTDSDEGLWQARLRFRQRTRNFQAVQDLQSGRFLFVLLFTTVFGPIVLVALIAFPGYAFFNSRRGR